MKFDKAVERAGQELLERYKEVIYKGYEVVEMTSNTTTSGYISKVIDMDSVKVQHIRNRFKEIDGEITAVKAIFDIKHHGKRKYNHHEEYFKVIN